MSTYEWVTNTGLNLNRFYSFVKTVPTDTPDESGYYSTPMQIIDLGAYRLNNLDLKISGRNAEVGKIFTLCNMTTWAEHYELPSAWCFVLTTTTGLLENSRWGFALKPDHKKLEKVLHPLGIGTPWNSTPHTDEILSLLKKHFPLTNMNNENPAFPALASSSHLHLSSLIFYLTTLTSDDEPVYI